MPKNGILESNYDFILDFINHSLPRSPFPVPFLVGWEKKHPGEVLVQRARLRKGRLERNARVKDLPLEPRMVGSGRQSLTGG